MAGHKSTRARTEPDSPGTSTDEQRHEAKKKRSSKGPREASTRRPVSGFRDVYKNDKKSRQPRLDPRFDERCGTFSRAHFERNYEHVDRLKSAELETLRQSLKTARQTGEDAAELSTKLQRAEDQRRTEKQRRLQRQTLGQLKAANIARMKTGLTPIFKTKAAVRSLHASELHAAMRKDGTYQKHLERVEKKKYHKERRAKFALPTRTRDADE